jgi:hypothetical protein
LPLALASTVNLSFRPCQYQRSYFYSIQTFRCFEKKIGLPLRESCGLTVIGKVIVLAHSHSLIHSNNSVLFLSFSLSLVSSYQRLQSQQINCCWPSPAQLFLVTGSMSICVFFADFRFFGNGASSLTKEVSVFLCRRYVCCTVVSVVLFISPHGVNTESTWYCADCTSPR